MERRGREAAEVEAILLGGDSMVCVGDDKEAARNGGRPRVCKSTFLKHARTYSLSHDPLAVQRVALNARQEGRAAIRTRVIWPRARKA